MTNCLGTAFIGWSVMVASLSGAFAQTAREPVTGMRQPPTQGADEYLPIEDISYALGSKTTQGFFLQRGGECSVVLMIAEKFDPERASPLSAARLRLSLRPSEVASIDSDEGPSLNFECGKAGASLRVTGSSTGASSPPPAPASRAAMEAPLTEGRQSE